MALTLDRKHNDSIVIVDDYGREIKITVEIGEHNTNQTIKLKFDAPREFDIYRAELLSNQASNDDSKAVTDNGNNS